MFPDLDPESGFYSENRTNLQLKTDLQLKLISDVKAPGLQGKPPALERAMKNKKNINFALFLGDRFGCLDTDAKQGLTRYCGKMCSFYVNVSVVGSVGSAVHLGGKMGDGVNVGKCKVMHMGHHNPAFNYTMNGQILEETKEERDIGVIVSSNMKPTPQCLRAAKTAQTVLGQLSRAFHYRDRHVFMRLYKQYVRPHLEFSTQAWAPWTEGDRNCLEKVQQRAVKMVSGLKSNVYEERLRELNLPTLLQRRHQADMAMVHKILHGKGGLDHTTWFEKAEGGLRTTRNTADPYNLRVKPRTGITYQQR